MVKSPNNNISPAKKVLIWPSDRKSAESTRLGKIPLNWLLMGWLCLLAVAILALLYIAVDVVVGGALYLYHTEGADPDLPIVEYLVPDPTVDQEVRVDALRPDFLYKPSLPSNFSPAARVVEFYAPWYEFWGFQFCFPCLSPCFRSQSIVSFKVPTLPALQT